MDDHTYFSHLKPPTKPKIKRPERRIRDKSRIYIGAAIVRWRDLRNKRGLESDAALTLFLLDWYQKVTTRTSKKCPLPTKKEDSNGYDYEPLVSVQQGSLPSGTTEPLATSADLGRTQHLSEDAMKSEPEDDYCIDEQLLEPKQEPCGPDDSEFPTRQSNWMLAEPMCAVTVRLYDVLKNRPLENDNSPIEPSAHPECGKTSENKDLKTHECMNEDSDDMSAHNDIGSAQDSDPDDSPSDCDWDHKRARKGPHKGPKKPSEKCSSPNTKKDNLTSDTPEPLSTSGDSLLPSEETKSKVGDEHSTGEDLQNTLEVPKSNQQQRGPKKIFKCLTCEKLFPRGSALKRHLVIHTGKRPFKCFICGRGFTQSGNLKTHMKVHKGASKWKLLKEKSPTKKSSVTVHVCGECGMDFPLKEQLEEHRNSHKKLFPCPNCDKSFKNEAYLKAHGRVHTGDLPFPCAECNKSFLSWSSLKAHRVKHSGKRNHHCKQCAKAFFTASHLKAHLQTHSGERPHLCAICGKSYVRAQTLKVHLRLHSGENPYMCDVCGKSFYYIEGYQAHRKVHDKKPKPPTKPLGRPKQKVANDQ